MWRKNSYVFYREIRQTQLRQEDWKHAMLILCAKKELDGIIWEWVRGQDRKFAPEGRKVALVIDNCTTHTNIDNLKSITFYFLPRNATSCLQLIDQGLIRSLKCKYRTRIIRTIINVIDNRKQMPSISILEAMKMLAHSLVKFQKALLLTASVKQVLRRVCQMKMMTPSLHSKVVATWWESSSEWIYLQRYLNSWRWYCSYGRPNDRWKNCSEFNWGSCGRSAKIKWRSHWWNDNETNDWRNSLVHWYPCRFFDVYSEWQNWNNSFESCQAVLKSVKRVNETNIYFRLFREKMTFWHGDFI